MDELESWQSCCTGVGMEKWTTPEPEVATTGPSFGFLEGVPQVQHPVAVPMLLPGTVVTVRTRNTLYRLKVVDGPTRQISISGGRLFPVDTDVHLVGAVDGEDGPKVGWIVEGLPLQLMSHEGPVITSVVEGVEVDADPTTLTDEDTF
jgi:hypothetical protein